MPKKSRYPIQPVYLQQQKCLLTAATAIECQST
jgi:hypothetical protein